MVLVFSQYIDTTLNSHLSIQHTSNIYRTYSKYQPSYSNFSALQTSTAECETIKDIVKLHKQGNSLVVTIPKAMAKDLGWKRGDHLKIETKQADNRKTLSVDKVE